MDESSLNALSPLDGRYAPITAPLRDYFSEAALIRFRLEIEIKYLIALSQAHVIRPLTKPENNLFVRAVREPPLLQIKAIENRTRHDVKAVEYYLRGRFQTTTLKDLIPYIHFGLTSEDINNLSYRLMVYQAQNKILIPQLVSVIRVLSSIISLSAGLPLLARTHGQPAIPTTLGKEIANFALRLLDQIRRLDKFKFRGKFNGAVGGYHAHIIAYPKINWPKFSHEFVTKLGFEPLAYTTQINPNDDLIELIQIYHHLNSILIGLCQDVWRYISDDWLVQTGKLNDVGSSTMPQKINPIEFENAEGNLTLANGLFETFTRKFPISRLQRDLSDSTVMRNLGVAWGHCLVAYHSLDRGLKTLAPNSAQIQSDLNANYAILGEALQTVMRKKGQADAYELIAKKFKTKSLIQKDWQKLVKNLAPELIRLTPSTYLGYSIELALKANRQLNHYLKGKI